MNPTLLSPVFFHFLAAVQAVSASLIPAREPITVLTSAQILSFIPYTYFASTGYCPPSETLMWNCGANCDANPGFQTIASGGDGGSTQFWFVGFDPTLKSVVVSHQGTDLTKIFSILTDVDFLFDCLDQDLFPGMSPDIKVHNGFGNQHARTARDVLAAVQMGLRRHGTTHVTMVGHSLGATLALLDAIYLPLHLPPDTTFKYVGYGLPRVGNRHFADYVDAQVQDVTRINNDRDPIPVLPPRLLGFHHCSGEVHIVKSDKWVSCSGQDNLNRQCSAGNVGNLNIMDHSGPYDGVRMGCGTGIGLV